MNINATNASSRLAAAALCGALCLGLCLPAGATGLEPLTVTVKYGDLDVSRPEGSAALRSRIRGAAERVCSPLDGGGIAEKVRLNECIDKAISDAVRTFPQPVRLASRQSRLPASRAASAR